MVESRSDPTSSTASGSVLVDGNASGPLLVSDVGISFWGGIDPQSGNIIDEHHPLKGSNVSGKILVIPSGRGSCSGSGALLELIVNNCAPAFLRRSTYSKKCVEPRRISGTTQIRNNTAHIQLASVRTATATMINPKTARHLRAWFFVSPSFAWRLCLPSII